MAKGKAPRAVVKAVKGKSKVAKAGSLTKELMDKAVRHIASEIVAARPGLDSHTPRGFAEGLLKEAQETFPRLTMNKVNYAVKLLKMELKKGSLSLNAVTNVSSLTDECEQSQISTTSTNMTSSTELSSESECSHPKRKSSATSNNISSKRSKGNADVTKTRRATAVIDNGSKKKKQPKKKSPTLSKIVAQEALQLGDQKALLIQLLGNFVTVLRRQQKKQCVS
jgi:hypothetical protein